jgi:hypothetical protein
LGPCSLPDVPVPIESGGGVVWVNFLKGLQATYRFKLYQHNPKTTTTNFWSRGLLIPESPRSPYILRAIP